MSIIIKGKEYVTINEYAKLCETTRQAIEYRIGKDIDYVVRKEKRGHMLIDIKKYPPVKNTKPYAGRKPKDKHRRPTKTVEP